MNKNIVKIALAALLMLPFGRGFAGESGRGAVLERGRQLRGEF